MRTLLLTLTTCLFVLPAYAKYSGGSGTAQDPYQIATAADLIALGETPEDYDKHFVLTADIDLDPNLPGRKVFDKALIAPDTNDATSWFEGTPFAGALDGGGHAVFHLTITGASYLGLFGLLGLGGEVRDLGVVDVNVIGSGSYVGGLVGNNAGTVAQCHSTGSIVGTGFDVGGLVGGNGRSSRGRASGGTVTRSFSTASVKGQTLVGGLVGTNLAGGVTYCYSTGPVSGDESIGGLAGDNDAEVTDCYSTGTIYGVRYVGGLVGNNYSTVARCYSTGSVSGTEEAGGLAGTNSGAVTACFWDIQTSGQTSSAGGTGETTTKMQTTGTFRAWGACGPFWTISEGQDYPHLAWENAPGKMITVLCYGGGTGTTQDPYLIYTAEDLNVIGLTSCHADKHFKLMADVDLSGYDGKDGRPVFNMIGPGQERHTEYGSYFVGTAFRGVFDGNGHTISRLVIAGESYLGLFGYLSLGAEVRDLSVVDVNVTGSGYDVGGLAGYNGGRLVHCHSTGMVSGNSSIGGLVGGNAGTVTGCYSTVAATVQGDYAYSIGGLVGTNSGVISECYSTGAVAGRDYVGGLVGYNYSGNVTCCYSTGSVHGNSSLGGLVGSGSPLVVRHSIWDRVTSGLSGSTGGVGLTTAEMMDPGVLSLNGFANDPNWVLDAGRDYPRLAWEGMAGTTIAEPNVDWLEGHGTAERPYQIDRADQLILLGRASLLWDRHFVLGADIDLDPNAASARVFGQGVIPVFTGIFDGHNHIISHLTIQGGSYLGLFGCVADPNAEIRNVTLTDPNVDGGSYVGALVGCLENGTISDCLVSGGRVSGESTVGALAGEGVQNGGVIVRCSAQDVEVSGEIASLGSAGGLVGSVGHGLVADCRVVGGVVRSGEAGGLAGSTAGEGTISRCYTSTSVKAGVDQGDGWLLFLRAGGLVGANAGTIESCYATGSVAQAGVVEDFHIWFFPSGVGGLVGYNSGTVRQSYSAGAVTGTVYVAGLVGCNDWSAHVTQCYSTSAVSGGTHIAGLVGSITPLLSNVVASFWDSQTSGQAASEGGTGKTTAEMQTAKTFLDAGWDFVGETANGTEDIWWINEGKDYPHLWWEAAKK
jgi:hypothetical protein